MIAKDRAVVGFALALYELLCPECQNEIAWEANFDADGTNYYGRCCNLQFVMRPHTVTIEVRHD